jgi:shikimate dehydrogenase
MHTMINGNTELIAHIGYPTHAFKAPMIYNPYFDHIGVNARGHAHGLPERGLPGLPARGVHAHQHPRRADHDAAQGHHRGLLDRVTPTVNVAGACNAVRRAADGALEGDLFDGEGFVRGVQRKGLQLAEGPGRWWWAAGGVGCAIAASLAAAGVGAIALHDRQSGCRRRHWPRGCARTTRRWRCAPARTTRRVSIWWSTPRRWA